jgi:hypothetical protein
MSLFLDSEEDNVFPKPGAGISTWGFKLRSLGGTLYWYLIAAQFSICMQKVGSGWSLESPVHW